MCWQTPTPKRIKPLSFRSGIEYWKKTEQLFLSAQDKAEAAELVKKNLPAIQSAAHQVVLENGYDYDVEVTFQNEYFTTREYDNFTLPAGRYDAVRVKIGAAQRGTTGGASCSRLYVFLRRKANRR